MTEREGLFWVAGFLEGEGSFGCYPAHSGLRVQAFQVERPPLTLLKSLVGGYITEKPSTRPKVQSGGHWKVCGTQAAGVMMTLYPMMSPKRQAAIRKSLALWKLMPGKGGNNHNLKKTHCSNGHEFALGTYYTSNGGRNCKQCVADNRDAGRAKAKAAIAAVGE